MAIIVLEGPDGGGKTTLANYLEKQFGYIYLHTGVPENEDLLLEYAIKIQRAREMSVSVVLDRLHVGESVYGPIIRKRDRLGHTGQVIIQRFVRASGAVLVFCRPPYEIALANWRKRHSKGEEYVDLEHRYEHIYDRYKHYETFETFKGSLTYDYSSCSLRDISETILQKTMVASRLPHEVIGSPSASVLFVGERANQTDLDSPWVDLSNSSHFFNTCLWEAGFKESEMMFVNALQLDHTPNNLHTLIPKLRVQHVVAVGGVASRALGKIPHLKIHHPAYWKRFHSKKKDTYVERLKEIRLYTAAPSV